MGEPRFLTEQQVIDLNRLAIEKDGGIHGVMNQSMLSSAVAMPQAGFGGQYLHGSLAAMAGAYLFHICQAHAFHDGNKRTAVLATAVFLDLNGCGLDVDFDDFEELVLGITAHEAGKEEAISFIEAHLVGRRGGAAV